MLAEIYAQALFKATSGADASQQEAAFTRLIERLKSRGHEKLLAKIYAAHRRLLERERRRSGAVLTIARGADEARARASAKALFPQDDVEAARVYVDPTLIGGWRFTKGTRRRDESFKRSLLGLYQKLTA